MTKPQVGETWIQNRSGVRVVVQKTDRGWIQYSKPDGLRGACDEYYWPREYTRDYRWPFKSPGKSQPFPKLRTRFSLAELLERLGDTPEKVAETLRRSGCRGRRQDCDACPVVDYLRRFHPQAIANRRHAFLSRRDRVLWHGGQETAAIHLPGPVCQFISQFDSGLWMYRDLEAA